jgi:hypothetical protein
LAWSCSPAARVDDATTGTRPYLDMQDGQLTSHPIRVAIAGLNVSPLQHARLFFVGTDSRLSPTGFAPEATFPNQVLEGHDGNSFERTLLLFELDDDRIVPWYKTGIRVTPVLRWRRSPDEVRFEDCQKKAAFEQIAGEDEVYIGNVWHAVATTILAIAVFFVILSWILNASRESRTLRAKILSLLCDQKGELSLSLTQMALWTLAIGATVSVFGLTRLKVPEIPDSLVLLMGMSLGTSVLSHERGSPSCSPASRMGGTSGSASVARSVRQRCVPGRPRGLAGRPNEQSNEL